MSHVYGQSWTEFGEKLLVKVGVSRRGSSGN